MIVPRKLSNVPGVHTLCLAFAVALVFTSMLQLATGRTAERRDARPPGTPAREGGSPAGVPKSFLEQAEDAIARQEYEASQTFAGLQAPNRAQNFRTYFEPWGVRVEDRTAGGHPELFRMRTASIGREGGTSTLISGDVRPNGARVENRRTGGIVEWYENSAAGLEHGYVLDRRPTGDGELAIDVVFEGAAVDVRGGHAVIAAKTGRRLQYGKLVVQDATGREVTSRIESAGGDTVRLAIEDTGAIYPLVVDPLLASTVDAMLESDQASAQLGTSVASAGDVNGDGFADVIVGSANFDAGQADEGAAFVFHGGPAGIASASVLTANATLQSDQLNAQMGFSVASAGDVNGDGFSDVIVGALNYTAGQSMEGAAFVFHGGSSGITSGNPGTANATLQADQVGAQLGTSVSGAGDVNGDGFSDVIVGAPIYSAGQSMEGAAFVFHGGSSGITSGNPGTANATLQADQVSAQLGTSVSGAGDVNGDGFADVIVGSYLFDAGQVDEGAAFVFHGGAGGIVNGNPGTANATLQSDQMTGYLGNAVAAAGDVNGDGFSDVIIGANLYDAGQADEGAAFVFHGGAGGVLNGNPGTANATLQSDQGAAELGWFVSGAGDVNGDGFADVIVGSRLYDAGQIDEGAAFVFHGGTGGIVSGNPATANATLQSDQASAQMGWSAAGAGDVNGDGFADVIVGAFRFDAGQMDEGAAFISLGGAEGVRNGNPATANATLQSDQMNARLGTSVAGAGDVNGDGFSDVIVGAPLYDAGQTDEGAAFVFHGGAGGIVSGNPGTANATLESDQTGSRFGAAVAGAGDVNGDGYADVIVGANNYDAGQTDEGAVFIFHGGPGGITSGNPTGANATLESNQASAFLGDSVAGAGDVNGDGYGDVIVGGNFYTSGESAEGAAFVFHGGPAGVTSGNPSTANTTLQADQTIANLGISVAGAGDVNGDGFADVIAGARFYDSGESNEGAAFVFHGSPAGVMSGNPGTANAILQSDQASAELGFSVAGAGDVNGDGFADVIAGARAYDSGQTDEGAAFVFHGSPIGITSGNPGTANATLQADQAFAFMGDTVATAGDVNGDGFADVIVGAVLYDSGESDEGVACVYHGGPVGILSGTPGTANALLQPNQVNAQMGPSAGAGDVNGDGFADVIVGSRTFNNPDVDEGLTFVFLGGGDGAGRPVRARQLRGGGGPINVEPWGSSLAADFQVEMKATHPEGRGRVKLEIEAVPAGENWGGPGSVTVVSPTWTDVTAMPAGVTLGQTVAGLPPSPLYRWRARVLYAPFSFATEPASPAHGPWRRVRGQAVEADIRLDAPCMLTCPPDVMTVTDPGQCGAIVVHPPPMIMGGCSVVNCVPAPGSMFPVGSTPVVCTEMGMGGAMCSFNVIVTDAELPTIVCPANVMVNTDPGLCSAAVTYATPPAMDNCPGATVNCLPASGTAFAIGVTTVTCTAMDASMNMAQCTFTVTVTDGQAPSVMCPPNIMTNVDMGLCTAVVTYATPTAGDNCPGATVNCLPASGSTFPQGVTTVTCTATDAAMNTTPCMFTVTVTDGQPPSLVCPGDISVNMPPNLCGAVVTFVPTASDNCPGVTVNCVPASGSTFPQGVTTVVCTAMDGMSMTSCMFTVTVTDNQPPSLACPADIVMDLAPGETSAAVNYTTPTPADNCPGVGTPSCSPASGTTFAVGTTTVTCSVTDANANTTMCSFTVTLGAIEPPPGSADVTLVKSVSPSLSAPGAAVTYSITATNNGPAVARNVTIADPLPTEVTYTSHIASPGASVTAPDVNTNGAVTAVWAGDTAVGESRTLTIVVTVALSTPDDTAIANTATVSSETPDPDTSSDASSVTVDVAIDETTPRADLSVMMSNGGLDVNTGDVVTYEIAVFNAGPDNAQDVRLFTNVPDGTRFSSITLDQGTADTPGPGGSGMIVCELGTVAAGASITILVDVVVRSDGGEFISNSASVESSTIDPVAVNNSRTDQVFVNEGNMVLLTWDPPDQTNDDSTPPPLHLQSQNVAGRGQTLVEAFGQARGLARRNSLIGFNIYRSNSPNVQTTPANLYSSTPPNVTQAVATAAPGGSFFTVTAVYPNGESMGANEATGGLPEPTITSIRIRSGKLIIEGTDFGNDPVIFVDGIPFTREAKLKPEKGRLVQKGNLLTGQSVRDYLTARQGVILVSVFNQSNGIGTFLYRE